MISKIVICLFNDFLKKPSLNTCCGLDAEETRMNKRIILEKNFWVLQS